MTNNEANPWPFHGKYQPEHFLPLTPLPLRLLQRTLDAVVPLSIVFSPSHSLSAPISDDDVLILHRVRRTGYAIFIQADLLITSTHILTPIHGYDPPNISCDNMECIPLEIPTFVRDLGSGLDQLSYLRLKNVEENTSKKVAYVTPTFHDALWVNYILI
jgi:hypothetical protein